MVRFLPHTIYLLELPRTPAAAQRTTHEGVHDLRPSMLLIECDLGD